MRLDIDGLDASRQGWGGQVGDESGQARQILMNGVKSVTRPSSSTPR